MYNDKAEGRGGVELFTLCNASHEEMKRENKRNPHKKVI